MDEKRTMSKYASREDLVNDVLKDTKRRLADTLDDTFVELPQQDVSILVAEVERLRAGIAGVSEMTKRAIDRLDGNDSPEH